MVIRKKITFVLLLLLFVYVFLGSYHHFCEYHSINCMVSSLAMISLLPPAQTEELLEPPCITSVLFSSAVKIPDVIPTNAPLHGRAPPVASAILV